MADAERLSFQLEANTSSFDSGMKAASQSLDSLSKKVATVNQQLKNQTSSGAAFGLPKGATSDYLAGAGVDMKSLGGVGQANNQWGAMLGTLNKIRPAIQDFANKMQTVQNSTQFTKMTAGLNMTDKQLRQTAASATVFYQQAESGITILNKMSSSLWVVSMGAQQLGTGLTLAMAPLAIIGGLAVKTSMEMEQSAASIQAAAGWIGTAGRAMRDDLTNNLKEVSMVMPESVANLQEYAYAAAQAGVETVDQITNFSVAMAKLRVTQKDYTGSNKDLADLLAKTSIAFRIPFENIDRTASVIARAAMSTVGGLKEIVDGLTRSSGAAVAFNISFGTMVGAMQTVIPMVGSASRAGTQLGQTFNKVAVNFGKAAKQMGMSSSEMKDRMNNDMEGLIMQYLGWLSTVGDKVGAIGNLTDIWGKDTARVLQILVERFPELTKNIADAKKEFEDANTLTQAYNVTADTMAGTWQKFKNILTALLSEIGDSINKAIAPLLNLFIQIAVAGLAAWRSLGEGTQRLILLIGGLLASVGPLILIFAKVFIDPIAGIITMTAKLGRLLITTGLLSRAAIAAGIAQTFQASATKSVGVASTLTTGSLLKQAYASAAASGGASVLGRVFSGLGGIFAALLPIIAVLGAALLALVGIAAAIGAAFHTNLFGIKDKFSGMFGGLKKGMGEANSTINKKSAWSGLQDNIDKSTGKIKDMGSAAGGAGKAMVEIAGQWGNKMVEKYISAFTELDTQVMGKTMDIAKQVFEEQEKLGRMTTTQVYNLTNSAQLLIAKMISQLKKGGDVASSVKGKLTDLIGRARVGSIIDEIKAAIKVDKFQAALDKLNESIEKLQDAAKKAVNKIEDQIKATEKAFSAEEKPLEKEIKNLNKQIKANQNAQKAELKPLQDKLKTDQEALKIAKENLEAKKKLDDAEIKIEQAKVDAAQKALDDAQDELDALKKTQQKYLNVAQNIVEYHKMNLDAAQRDLEMQTSMGRDEFDLSWRLAQARAQAADDQVTLAETQLAIIENISSDQNDTMENATKSLQDYIDTQAQADSSRMKILQKSIEGFQTTLDNEKEFARNQKDAFDAQEDALQVLVDNAQLFVDADNDAIDAMNEKWDAIIEPLKELADAEDERLTEIKDAHQEYLDTLNEEKDALQEKYDTEIELEQAKVDAAQKSLDDAKKAYDKIQTINQQLLAMEAARISAEQGPSGGGGGGGVIEPGDLGDIGGLKDIMDQLDSLDEQLKNPPGTGFFSGIIDGIYNLLDVSDSFSAIKAEFIDMADWLGGTAFGQSLEQLYNWFVDEWGPALSSSFGAAWTQFLSDTAAWWADLKSYWTELWGGPDDGGFLIKLVQSYFSSQWTIAESEWSIHLSQLEAWWTKVKIKYRDGYDQLSGIVGGAWQWIKDNIGTKLSEIWNNLQEKWASFKNYIGTKLSEIKTSVSGKWSEIKSSISGALSDIWNNISSTWDSIKTKISEVAGSIWGAIKEKFKDLKGNIGDIMGEIGGVVEDAFKDSFTWGKDMIENLVKGIKNAWDRGKASVGKIVSWIKDKLGFSENKYMPTQTWGEHMIENFTKGITLKIPTLDNSLKAVQASISGLSGLSIPESIGIATLDTSALARSGEYAVKPPETKTAEPKSITQNSGNIYNINPGMMVASKGEIREFARLLSKFQKIEESRVI